jgi:hypothetical protein
MQSPHFYAVILSGAKDLLFGSYDEEVGQLSRGAQDDILKKSPARQYNSD